MKGTKKFDKKAYDKDWRKNNPESVRKSRRKWELKNPEKAREINRRKIRRNYLKNNPIKNLKEKISARVPSSISGLVRDDVCQQLAVEVLSGTIGLKEIPKHVERVRKEQSKFLPSRYQYRLDALEPWQRERMELRVRIG